jgi:hypothetical protein
MGNQDYPFEKLFRELQGDAGSEESRASLSQVFFFTD